MVRLKAEEISASYYANEILHSVTIEVTGGEKVGLLGANGAGKSTLLKVIAGIISPSHGAIYFNGKKIDSLPPHLRMGLGIGYFPQGGEVFPDLTCEENLILGALNLPKGCASKNLLEIYQLFPLLEEKRKQRANLFSGGEKQMLSLGISLIRLINYPEALLLLDEPSSGLAPILLPILKEKINQINREFGTSIITAEQNIHQASQICNRVYLLKEGRVVWEEKHPTVSSLQRMFELHIY